MGKKRIQAPSIYSLSNYLKEENFLPVYFLCGEDQFTIDAAAKTIEKALNVKVTSDFDKETIDPEKNQKVGSLIDLASAFPFGGGSKVIVVKNFDRYSDKKNFTEYINRPAEFTHLIITHHGKVADFSREPFDSLIKNNFLFEARKLKGAELVKWVIKTVHKHKLKISGETAQIMVDIIGDEKGLIEMQINKLVDYLEEGSEIEASHLKNSITSTKEFSIFELQDSLGMGEKKKSINIAIHLLDSGMEIVAILGMLSKFITTLAKSLELSRQNLQLANASSEAGVSMYYYKNCIKSRYLLNEKRLLQASRALLSADLSLKTSAYDAKTIMVILISEILI
jgi:DNA polymerase III subunit delta